MYALDCLGHIVREICNELCSASRRTEIIVYTSVLCAMRRRIWIHGHSADRIGHDLVRDGFRQAVIDMAMMLVRMLPLIPVSRLVGGLLVHKHDVILICVAAGRLPGFFLWLGET